MSLVCSSTRLVLSNASPSILERNERKWSENTQSHYNVSLTPKHPRTSQASKLSGVIKPISLLFKKGIEIYSTWLLSELKKVIIPKAFSMHLKERGREEWRIVGSFYKTKQNKKQKLFLQFYNLKMCKVEGDNHKTSNRITFLKIWVTYDEMKNEGSKRNDYYQEHSFPQFS